MEQLVMKKQLMIVFVMIFTVTFVSAEYGKEQIVSRKTRQLGDFIRKPAKISGRLPTKFPSISGIQIPFLSSVSSMLKEDAKKFGIPENELFDAKTITVTYPGKMAEKLARYVIQQMVSFGKALFDFIPSPFKNLLPSRSTPDPTTLFNKFFTNNDKTMYERYDNCKSKYFVSGHCRYLQHCLLTEYVYNVSVLLENLCTINGVSFGVCCPDASVSPISLEGEESQQFESISEPPKTEPSKEPETATEEQEISGRNTVTDDFTAACGIRISYEIRIKNGRNATGLTFLGAITDNKSAKRKKRQNNEWDQPNFCAGSLISRNYVISAAHCFQTRDLETLQVEIMEETIEGKRLQTFGVSEIIVHPNFNATSKTNDIAILKLSRPVIFEESTVRPICMPIPNKNYFGEDATIAGWGSAVTGGQRTRDFLKEAKIPVWNNTECSSILPNIVETSLCAGDREGSPETCQGDSGGPLMLQGIKKRWMLIGIVSWGHECKAPGIPGVYTRVTEYLKWIEDNVQKIA